MDAGAGDGFCGTQENLAIQEEIVKSLSGPCWKSTGRISNFCSGTSPGWKRSWKKPFARMSYDAAIEHLQSQGHDIQWGDDFGAPDETALANLHDGPVFVERFPAAIKAFYMKPIPSALKWCLLPICWRRKDTEKSSAAASASMTWICSCNGLRNTICRKRPSSGTWTCRYGSVPHSGFGIGLERFITWICGLSHLRAIPFPGCSTASTCNRQHSRSVSRVLCCTLDARRLMPYNIAWCYPKGEAK